MGRLKRRLDSLNTALSRTANPLKPIITEAHIRTQTSTSGDTWNGLGCSGFFAGQHWCEMMAHGMYKGIEWINFWSAVEGSGMGYLKGGAGVKKSTYYHMEQMAKWFKGNIYFGADDSCGTGNNSKSFKSFAAKTSNYIAVLVLNQDDTTTSLSPYKVYQVGLNNNSTSTSMTRLNYNLGLNKTYIDTIKYSATTLLIFDCNGNISAKYRYEQTDKNNPFKSAWASGTPATIVTCDIGPDQSGCAGAGYTFVSTGTQPHGTTYQWYVNGSAVSGATSNTYVHTTSASSTTITCTVTYNGCTASDDAILTTHLPLCGAPPPIVTGLADNNNAISTEVQALVPNPANNQVTVYYSIARESKTAELIITNFSGQTVGKYKLNPEESKIDLNCTNLPAGLYFTSLVSEGQMLNSKKLVIVK